MIYFSKQTFFAYFIIFSGFN